MKKYTKIVLLVALALFLTLTACQRQVATSPVNTPTSEVPFPVGGASPIPADAFATQTAAAQATPATGGATTPQVSVMTETPTAGQTTGGGEAGGGQAAQPTATQAAGTGAGTAATPAAPTKAPLPIPTVARPTGNYTLQNGEFPYCIARRYDLDIASLLSLNGLNSNSKPGVGTQLKIPATGTWNTASYGQRALAKHPATYTVAAGDNIYSISCKYGDLAPDQILAANGLTKPTDIKTGMSLKIP